MSDFHFESFEWVKPGRGRPRKENPQPRYQKKYPDRSPGNTRGRLPKTNPDEREFKMRDLFLEGKTMQEIGDLQEPPVSRERVRQLIKKYFGIVGNDGGRFVRATPNIIHEEIEKEKNRKETISKRYAKFFKCTIDEFLSINGKHWTQSERFKNPKEPANAYFNQKKNAETQRYIKWYITFPEWWSVWQESGHWEQRGRGKGYCMTRIGDTGGYEVGNVEIKTTAQNFSDSYFKHPSADRFKKRLPHSQGTKTHCRSGHERTEENSSYIGGKRVCRLCNNERSRKRYALLKAKRTDV